MYWCTVLKHEVNVKILQQCAATAATTSPRQRRRRGVAGPLDDDAGAVERYRRQTSSPSSAQGDYKLEAVLAIRPQTDNVVPARDDPLPSVAGANAT